MRLAVAFLTLMMGLSRIATAQSAFDLLNQGVQLRRDGKDEEALRVFRRAYEGWPSPRVLAQIGLAEQALGQWTDARRDLVRALEGHDDSWIKKNESVLREGLRAAETHLGALVVESDVPGAELWIQGARVATLPMRPLYREPGAVDVEVRARGHASTKMQIALEAGRSTYLRMALETPQAPPAVEAGAPRPLEAPSLESERPSASVQRTAAWMTAAGTVGFLAAGIVAHVEREQLASKYNDPALCSFGGLTREERCAAYRQDANLFQTFAVVGYSTAGALAVTSLLLFVTEPRSAAPRAGVVVSPWGAHAQLSTSF
jgi:tetratricopeptide (TPR) repeat protein